MKCRTNFFVVLCTCCSFAIGSWGPGIPTGWTGAPGVLTEFPQTKSKKGYPVFTANPWLYSHRLGLYKVLLASTPNLQKDDGWGNPLWGLPLQFSWQHDTGRLFDSEASGIVNQSSWWANMNYFLSVVPFVAAMDAGVFDHALPPNGAFKIAQPSDPSDSYCVDYATCKFIAPNATIAWRAFFSRVSDPPVSIDEAVQLLWKAHVHSLHEGTPRAQPLLALLPSKAEANFGLGWANLVDFVAAMQYDVDYNQTNKMQALVVPPRMLTDADNPPFVKDFTPAENRAAASIELCYYANNKTNGGLLELFQALCCTPAGRKDAANALIGFMANPMTDVVNIVKLLVDLVKAHPCPH